VFRKQLAVLGVALLLATPTYAAEEAGDESDDLPIPTMKIDRVAPSVSYEFAAQMSFGTITYWRDFVPAWIGLGLRGGWGKNFGNNRLGIDGTFSAEGPFGVHTSIFLEPVASWNLVTNQGLLVGAGVGPAFMYHVRNDMVIAERAMGIAPSAAVRVGWSQTWTRVGRRVFVFVEPKMRYVDGKPNPLVALAFGSGQGR